MVQKKSFGMISEINQTCETNLDIFSFFNQLIMRSLLFILLAPCKQLQQRQQQQPNLKGKKFSLLV